jgi:hypothetical protein
VNIAPAHLKLFASGNKRKEVVGLYVHVLHCIKQWELAVLLLGAF